MFNPLVSQVKINQFIAGRNLKDLRKELLSFAQYLLTMNVHDGFNQPLALSEEAQVAQAIALSMGEVISEHTNLSDSFEIFEACLSGCHSAGISSEEMGLIPSLFQKPGLFEVMLELKSLRVRKFFEAARMDMKQFEFPPEYIIGGRGQSGNVVCLYPHLAAPVASSSTTVFKGVFFAQWFMACGCPELLKQWIQACEHKMTVVHVPDPEAEIITISPSLLIVELFKQIRNGDPDHGISKVYLECLEILCNRARQLGSEDFLNEDFLKSVLEEVTRMNWEDARKFLLDFMPKETVEKLMEVIHWPAVVSAVLGESDLETSELFSRLIELIKKVQQFQSQSGHQDPILMKAYVDSLQTMYQEGLNLELPGWNQAVNDQLVAIQWQEGYLKYLEMIFDISPPFSVAVPAVLGSPVVVVEPRLDANIGTIRDSVEDFIQKKLDKRLKNFLRKIQKRDDLLLIIVELIPVGLASEYPFKSIVLTFCLNNLSRLALRMVGVDLMLSEKQKKMLIASLENQHVKNLGNLASQECSFYPSLFGGGVRYQHFARAGSLLYETLMRMVTCAAALEKLNFNSGEYSSGDEANVPSRFFYHKSKPGAIDPLQKKCKSVSS